MSDWDISLIRAGTLPMRDGLMAPRGELGDIVVASNVVLLRGAAGTLLIDTAAGATDNSWEGASSDLAGALAPFCRLDEIDTVVLTHLDFDHCGGAPDVPAPRVIVTATAAAWASCATAKPNSPPCSRLLPPTARMLSRLIVTSAIIIVRMAAQKPRFPAAAVASASSLSGVSSR